MFKNTLNTVFLTQLLSDPNKTKDATVANQYNLLATLAGKNTISAATVGRYRRANSNKITAYRTVLHTQISHNKHSK